MRPEPVGQLDGLMETHDASGSGAVDPVRHAEFCHLAIRIDYLTSPRLGLLIKDFGKFVEQQSERLKIHAEKLAETLGRPFKYINGKVRKDHYAKEIAKRDGITQGLICVLRILEPCQSFKVVPAEKRPKLVNATRKCLCDYFYFMDRDFGLMHVRIQSWFPLVIQICLNGHEWLARKLDKHGKVSPTCRVIVKSAWQPIDDIWKRWLLSRTPEN